MPYIASEDRPALDNLIEPLVNQIKFIHKKYNYPGAFAGVLNYVITRLCIKVAPAKRYWVIAIICGVLVNVILELYRRVASPYEDEQIKKNGDVGYDEFGKASS